MRVLVLSDLHLEFHKDGGASFIAALPTGDQVDVCVLAGDIAVGPAIPEGLQRFCDRYAQVVFVHGNHEFYGYSRASVLDWTQKAVDANSNLTWLDCETKVVAGQRFVGAPLWFRRAPQCDQYREYMNDFHTIRDFEGWVYEENRRALKHFESIQSGDVVVTHHLPSPRSVHARYKDSHINCFFLCDVEPTIKQRQPAVWIHGHTHSSTDYRLGTTRVVCNPFGYGDENELFVFNHIIQIP